MQHPQGHARVTEAANAATLTAGTVAVDVPHIAGNYVTGAWHFYDFLSGDHDRLTVKWPSALVCGRRGPRAPDARHRPRNAGRPGMAQSGHECGRSVR